MNNNYAVIMAGGVGSRFWPFSTEEKPKQFLDFLGTGRSLLQMTYDRLAGIVQPGNIVVVTNKRYRDLVSLQLPELDPANILLEPIRRNTAPCIAYAAYRIARKCPKANIIVLPSDHLVAATDEFRRILREGLRFVAYNDALLTLGIKPTRPETGYGYIQYTKGGGELSRVKTFTEKPNREMARVFLSSGEFCWNSGMFLWRADVIIDAFRRYLPDMADSFEAGARHYHAADEQQWVDSIFPALQNISIDYGVMEKADNVYVMLSDFGWSDMGTWSTLYELAPHQADDNCSVNGRAVLHNCHECLTVLNDDDIAIVDGLEGYLIAHNGNKILICKKDDESRIRLLVNDIVSNR